MIKYWTKLINSDGKIIKDYVVERKKFEASLLHETLSEVCDKLDVPTPIILSKHISNLTNYNSAIFLPADFLEKVKFVKMIVEIY